MTNENKPILDIEWARLILEAKKLGITKEDLRAFIRHHKALKRKNNKDKL